MVAILAVLAGAADLLTRVDHSVARWAYEHPPFSHRVLTLVTDLGEAWTVLIVAVAVAMVDFVRRRSYWALPFMLVVILGAKLWTQLLKQLFAVAVATSRVLLDVHWLTDVIGGLALGWAWFAIGTIAFARLLRSGAPALSDPGSSRRGR